MSYVQPDTASLQGVYRKGVEARARFITRTYSHLLGAILAFAALEVAIFNIQLSSGLSLAQTMAQAMFGNWLLVLGAMMVVGWGASRFAHSTSSKGLQYLGLGIYVVAEAIIFVPLLFMAQSVAPGAIQSASLVTLLGFGGLTAIAFTTRKDFSFLSSLIKWGFVMALVAIVASLIFGFQLGVLFSIAMVALAGMAILRDTSSVLLHFPEDRYVGAALQLFASVALMLWYVLRIFMSSRD